MIVVDEFSALSGKGERLTERRVSDQWGESTSIRRLISLDMCFKLMGGRLRELVYRLKFGICACYVLNITDITQPIRFRMTKLTFSSNDFLTAAENVSCFNSYALCASHQYFGRRKCRYGMVVNIQHREPILNPLI